ncbi:AAA family ATPase [Hymenobacter arcticus]
MLTSLRIQNFRSIRDASVKLGQVNLFIGPNNSGKSNFLKGIELLSHSLVYQQRELIQKHFSALIPRSKLKKSSEETIRFQAQITNKPEQLFSLIMGYRKGEYIREADEYINEFHVDSVVLTTKEPTHNFPKFVSQYFEEDSFDFPKLSEVELDVRSRLSGLQLYKLNPNAFELSTELSDQPHLEASGQNIGSFLYTLSQNHEAQFLKLKHELASCVGSLTSVSAPPDPNKKGNLRLKFFDASGDSYWAEEVSEGVLYFLALLCIVHQPDPPKLLLLEEPEKGIHPRRIKEIMDFIFELARLRDIQIIITSHSPYVVDHFADIPECISVFDRVDGETVIHNAADIIQKTNEEYAAQGLPPTKYTDSLGEYWVSGFLGGVPL